jgi:hypothetical protein
VSNQIELKAALTDVRRAYRLVYAYQRRVFDLIGAVADPLETNGFEFDRWEPTIFFQPGRSFYKPDKWAWDFLPAYHFWAGWNRDRHGDVRRVLIAVNSDTGFERKRGEPDPADFIPAEKAQSELRLTLIRAETAPAWDRLNGILATLDSAQDGADQDVDVGGVPVSVRRVRLDLSELIDEAAVDRRLLAPLRQWIG